MGSPSAPTFWSIWSSPLHVSLIQNVIGACLEKEDVCNEFYVQLIKQTTDMMDVESEINKQNWRLFAMILGVVVPRHPQLLNLIKKHLNFCAADGSTSHRRSEASRTLPRRNVLWTQRGGR